MKLKPFITQTKAHHIITNKKKYKMALIGTIGAILGGLSRKMNVTFSPTLIQNFGDSKDLKEPVKECIFDLLVELETRVATVELVEGQGDEMHALKSLVSIFPIAREEMKKAGYKAIEFTDIAKPLLNEVIRPFTTKWAATKFGFEGELQAYHVFSDFVSSDEEIIKHRDKAALDFRQELRELQSKVLVYCEALRQLIAQD